MSILRSTLRSFGKFRPVVAPVRFSRTFASGAAPAADDEAKVEEVTGPQDHHYERTVTLMTPRHTENAKAAFDAAVAAKQTTLGREMTQEELHTFVYSDELAQILDETSFKNNGQDFPTSVLSTENELAPETPSALSFWGRPAVFGSAGVVVLAKELMVLNDEIFLIGGLLTAAAVYYVTAGDIYRTNAALWTQAKHDWRWEKMLLEKRKLQEVIAAREATLGMAEVTKKFFDYKQNLRERLFQARTHRKHQAAAEAILAQFQSTHAKESAGGDAEKKLIAENATKFALEEFKANPKTKEQVILEGLSLMDGSAKGEQKDQIGELFSKYLTKYEAEQGPLRAAAAKEAAKKNVSEAEFQKIVKATREAQLAVYK